MGGEDAEQQDAGGKAERNDTLSEVQQDIQGTHQRPILQQGVQSRRRKSEAEALATCRSREASGSAEEIQERKLGKRVVSTLQKQVTHGQPVRISLAEAQQAEQDEKGQEPVRSVLGSATADTRTEENHGNGE
jgi:hypothetical protein